MGAGPVFQPFVQSTGRQLKLVTIDTRYPGRIQTLRTKARVMESDRDHDMELCELLLNVDSSWQRAAAVDTRAREVGFPLLRSLQHLESSGGKVSS